MSDVDRTPMSADGPSKQSSETPRSDAMTPTRTTRMTRPTGALCSMVAGPTSATLLAATPGVGARG